MAKQPKAVRERAEENFELSGAPEFEPDQELDAAIEAVAAAAVATPAVAAAIPVPPRSAMRTAAAEPPTRSDTMNTEQTMRSIGADAQAEIADLRAKVEALMSERVTPAVTAVAEQAGAAMRGARDEVRGQTARVSHAVQEQPLMALGIAALAGFMVAVLTRR